MHFSLYILVGLLFACLTFVSPTDGPNKLVTPPNNA